MIEPQILTTDYWSRFMTSVVAVCLTLISPYMFIIVKCVLSWFFWLLGLVTTESNPRRPSSTSAESQGLLGAGGGTDYGATGTSKTTRNSVARDPHRDDGAAHGIITRPASNEEVVPSSSHVSDQVKVQEQEGAQDPKATKDISPIQRSSSRQNGQTHEEVSGPGMGLQPGSPREGQDSLAVLDSAESSREFGWKFMKSVGKGVKTKWTSGTLIIVVLAGIFVAWAAIGVISADIASNKVGLSSSQNCGIWHFDKDAGDEAAYRDDLNNFRKEERASQYARNCYNTPDAIDTLSCGIFYNQSVSFVSKSRQKCPFPSSELCWDGPYSAVSFDTGYIDASILGINAPVTHKFRRTSTCSPLNMSEPYIKKSPDTNDSSYHYNYGPSGSANFTFDTSGDPFDWLVPVYSMK